MDESKEKGVLVTINSGERVFSSGFDLKFWRAKWPQNSFISIATLRLLIGRVLTLSKPSLCVFNGHSIAGGAMLGLAHDQIYMVDNPRFKVQLNELDLPLAIPKGLMEFVKETTSPNVARTLCLG